MMVGDTWRDREYARASIDIILAPFLAPLASTNDVIMAPQHVIYIASLHVVC